MFDFDTENVFDFIHERNNHADIFDPLTSLEKIPFPVLPGPHLRTKFIASTRPCSTRFWIIMTVVIRLFARRTLPRALMRMFIRASSIFVDMHRWYIDATHRLIELRMDLADLNILTPTVV